MGRIAAIDYGEKRIGLAVSDETKTHVFPRQKLLNEGKKKLFADLADFVRAEQVEKIVIGLPLSLSGHHGPQAQTVQKFGSDLEQALSLPVEYEDERYSSALADRFPDSSFGRDSLAAVAILELYLGKGRR